MGRVWGSPSIQDCHRYRHRAKKGVSPQGNTRQTNINDDAAAPSGGGLQTINKIGARLRICVAVSLLMVSLGDSGG